MKRTSLHSLLAAACTILTLGANAGTQENFNSRNTASLHRVKAYLQDQCWIFRDFEINRAGWTPGIDGDGAMVSGTAADASKLTAIFTPLVKINGKATLSFDYKFSAPLKSGSERSMTIALTDYNGTVIKDLDNVQFSNIAADQVLNYKKNFEGIESGAYKLMVRYTGHDGSTRIAIDNFNLDAEPLFNSGCKTAPVAAADVIFGEADYTAKGNLLENDLVNDKNLSVSYAVTDSKDGSVKIDKAGNFEFTPNVNFNGSATSFTYKVCDLGYNPLCSEDAKVTIHFPAGSFSVNDEILAQSLNDFKGFYQEDGKVEIKWVTNFEQNCDRFEIERSLDGANWTTAGSLKGQGVSANKQAYSFVDKVGRNVVHKNDLYYRLKQVNLDKRSSLSKILVVRVFNKKSLRMVSVTPNPVKNDISVNVQLNENSFVVMKIVNTEGNEMMRKSQRVEEGQSSFVMDGSNKLTPGMYFLEVTVNSKDRMIAKLLKE
ncbi:MAG: T9SS type A sorting domain-containing protein [Sphingobacteriales bacterium]|nr:MAG: T9SS type A sorting domain-containing protein [Sphingobacteriales bacterium]